MKKTYQSPRVCVYDIVGQTYLMDNSIKVGSTPQEKVSNSSDIGFVKGNSRPNNYDVWDDDWSKQH